MIKKSVAMLLVFALLISSAPMGSLANSTTTTQIILYLDKTDAFVNLEVVKLDTAPTVVNGKTFLPAKFLGEALGFNVQWIDETKTIIIEPTDSYIEINLEEKTVFQDGTKLSFNDYVYIDEGRSLVQMGWILKELGALYQYDSDERKIEINYLSLPSSISNRNPSTPVARFTFGKPHYRIGEPIKLVDLSYDPDGENLSKSWTGKEEVYFKSGTHPITLTVTDTSGNVSEAYTKYITIVDDVYLSQSEYPLYFQKEGTSFQTNLSLASLNQIPHELEYDFDRKLLVSDSPEVIKEQGILYQDTIDGKARLYANHINGMQENVTFAILATNETDEDIKITTTNSGEVMPTPLVNLMGHIASVDFLLDEDPDSYNVVKANETIFYKIYPDFLPQSGVNTFYDIQTDGELTFSFVAMEDADIDEFEDGDYDPLDYDGHVRGSFPASDIYIEANPSGKPLTEPYRLSIGDENVLPYLEGYDELDNDREEVINKGHYGMTYNITIDNPGEVVVLLRPRGGAFKGPMKINGELIMAPTSGVLTHLSGVYILKRTTGYEKTLDIELTPPAGSAFPVDLIFYPLKDLK
ncbi:stalk domain-containing protein [Chengkuizengella axinellae]|uniref:Stalk domain-containing protein n=1 Tax=Chengkuizengella axinellae TaxID=3064388 RepID=A0ABT9J4L3_9BACL|nr:stalk domain-containing protein [Chengkuizengella sp. 2205SS18-9]MDP5275925.1 stalk domain-containing protein [Chengkuizengella sp. 2205SS18-9]